jgi:hypothetical protein
MPECPQVPSTSSLPDKAVPRSAMLRASQWLAPAVALLLFAQWPLRDLLGAGALLANDVAQALFALYVAIAVSHASARGQHLAAHPDALAHSRWRRIGAALIPLPWCAWLLFTSAQPVLQSLALWERFPESSNPGYFLIKLALPLLALGIAWQCLRALQREFRA